MRDMRIHIQAADVAAWALDLLWMIVLVALAVPRGWLVVAILVAIGYLFHRLRRCPLWASMVITGILSLVGYGALPDVLTIALVVLGVLWGFVAAVQPPQRTLMWALVIAIAEAVYRGSFWWTPWAILAMGLFALALKSPREGRATRLYGVVAGLTGLVALLMAAAVAGILWLIPWVWIVQNTVGRVAAALVSLVPLLHVHPHHHKTTTQPGRGHLPRALHVVNHTEPVIVGILLAIVVIGLIWVLWRLLRQAETEHDGTDEEESFIIREHLADLESLSSLFRSPLLTPVRQLVRRRLRKLRGKPQARHPGETLRQWAQRVYGTVFYAVTAYEEVRYGSSADTEALAKEVEKNWAQQNVIE